MTPNVLNLVEGSSDTYEVALHSPPTDTVTIMPTAPAGTDVTVRPSALVFATGTWDLAQTFTVQTSSDSDAVTPGPVSIGHAASGGDYEGVSVDPVTVKIAESDVRGVVVSKSRMRVEEGASQRYGIVLMSEPTSDVEVSVRVAHQSTAVAVDKNSVTFTPQDWHEEQEIEVSVADDDDVFQANAVTIQHAASGGDYGTVPVPSVEVTPVENDGQTLEMSLPEAVESAGPLVFEVWPREAGTDEIVVNYSTPELNHADGATSGADYTEVEGTLRFTAGTTAVQTIDVPLIDDMVDESEIELVQLLLSVVSPVTQDLFSIGEIEDDDDPIVHFTFDRASSEVTEGASATITARLSADSERLIEIPLVRTHHGGATDLDYVGVPSSLIFTSGERRKEFVFRAVDDHEDDDGESLVLSLGILPEGVLGTASITLGIRDNDGGGGGSPPAGGGGGSPPAGGGDDGEDDGEDDDAGGGSPPADSGGPPRAAFGLGVECAGHPCSARTGVPVAFTDTSSGSVRFRRWGFGDGTESRRQSVEHAWSEPGFYEVSLWVSNGTDESTTSRVFLVEASDPAGSCQSDAETLCLQDSRYQVRVEWWTSGDDSGPGSVVHAGTNDSGLFRFFSRSNWEILIKVLDGCSVNGSMWVYGASTTDLGYTIRVTDTVTGAAKEYRNQPGLPAPAITDPTAFPQGCRP